MTVQINQDPRQTLTLHATKGFSPSLYGLTKQLNYMCNSMCMCVCLYAAILTTASLVINPHSCIKHKQISVPNVYLRACEFCFERVCVFVHECGGKCVLCERGAQRGAAISCVQVAVFEGWQGGGVRTCRPCVWEPRAPHFSYIVLLLLQTVNATKDAQPIVARDCWGGRALGRRQAREEGSGLAWA